MKQIAKIIFCVVLASAVQARAEGDLLLYFQIVDSPTIVNLAGDEVPYGDYTWNGYKVNAARVVSMGGGGDKQLHLGYKNANADGTFVDMGAATLPMDSQHLPMSLYAVLPSNASELSFAIELGNYDSGTWTTLATSGSLAYSSLATAQGQTGYTYLDSSNPMSFTVPWAPTAYPVPEPSSGLLALLGAGLLALKRRRR